MNSEDAAVLYNLACFFAQAGESDRAFECLRTCIAGGYSHRQWVENDSDLDPIRDDPRYEEMLRLLD